MLSFNPLKSFLIELLKHFLMQHAAKLKKTKMLNVCQILRQLLSNIIHCLRIFYHLTENR